MSFPSLIDNESMEQFIEYCTKKCSSLQYNCFPRKYNRHTVPPRSEYWEHEWSKYNCLSSDMPKVRWMTDVNKDCVQPQDNSDW